MFDIEKYLPTVTLDENKNYDDFGSRLHYYISNYLIPFSKLERATDKDTENEITAVKKVMNILKSHKNLTFVYEDYFETVFKIKNTDYVLTLNTPFNLVEKGSPAYFEYKIKTPEDIFLTDYKGSWEKEGVILSIREELSELIFDDSKLYEKNRSAYARAISAVYNSKTEMEVREKLNDVFEILSNAINFTSSDLGEFDNDYIAQWAQTFFQLCAFVVENKELVSFSTSQLPVYINKDKKLVFHNVIENQALSYELDYSLDLDQGLSEEQRRQKVVNDTVDFFSDKNNLERSLLDFNPLDNTLSLPKGEIESVEKINFGQLIFFLYCYLQMKKKENPEQNLSTAQIANPIFNILNKSSAFEKTNLFRDDLTRYYRIRERNLGIIISFDDEHKNLTQTYSRLFALVDQHGVIMPITIKQKYSIPFGGLPFSIILIEDVKPIKFNKDYDIENKLENLNHLVNAYEHKINNHLHDEDAQFNEITSCISGIFTSGLNQQLKNINYKEIAYNLTKFSQIIHEETNLKVTINQNTFLVDRNGNFILGNPITH